MTGWTRHVDGLRRLLRQFARPARTDRGGYGVVVEPYRGYGTDRELHLMGRVFWQPGGRARGGDLRGALARLLRRGAPGYSLEARFGDARQRLCTDADGYFHLRMQIRQEPPREQLWHTVELELPGGATAVGEVFIPPHGARFVVISDIDDTVMFTGVANKAKMLWRLFAQGAHSRTAFPGVAAFYRALHGAEQNPILYVSRGPWSIYSMLERFFQLHRIPVGPVLFLREWGLSLSHPLPRRAEGHKLRLIRDMLALYHDLPFVLIGDSGQHDPEIYAQIVREHPQRVAAVYIRNVDHHPERAAVIDRLADEVVSAGSSLLLAADTMAMAEHAAAHGLVPASARGEIAQARAAAPDHRRRRPLRSVRRGNRAETRRAVARGELERTLDSDEDTPPNTVVEAQRDRAPRR